MPYKLYIFDKDQTISSPFTAQAYAAMDAFKRFAKVRADARGEKTEEVYNQIIIDYKEQRQNAIDGGEAFQVYHWYWDIENMIPRLPVLQPKNDTELVEFLVKDKEICDLYHQERQAKITHFDGIVSVLQTLQARNVINIICSDGRRKEIDSAFEITQTPTDMFNALVCQGDEKVGATYKTTRDIDFYQFEGRKTQEDALDIVRKLIKSYGVNKDDVVMIGDNKNDALVAKGLNIDFAWAAYGADLPAEIITWNNDTLNDAYRFGIEANKAGIDAVGYQPRYVLKSPQDILAL